MRCEHLSNSMFFFPTCKIRLLKESIVMCSEYGKVAISMPVMGKLYVKSEISLISIEGSNY